MPQINLRVTQEFQDDLALLMREAQIYSKSEAIRFAVGYVAGNVRRIVAARQAAAAADRQCAAGVVGTAPPGGGAAAAPGDG